MKSSTVVDFILISIMVLLLEINNVASVLLEVWHPSLPLCLYLGEGGRLCPPFCGRRLTEVRRCGNHKNEDYQVEADFFF